MEWRELTPEQVPAAASLLVEAFEANPAYGYIFHRFPEPRRALQWLFENNLHLHLKKRCTRVGVGPSGGVDATLTWVPPGGAGIGLWDLVKQGVLLMPVRFGPSSLPRLQEMMATVEQMQQRLMHQRPYWYLSMVAVRGSLRGRGVGSAMILQHLTGVVDAHPAVDAAGRPQPHGVPVALLTQFESNVCLYRSLGFEVIEENTLGRREGGGVRSWFMVRESRYSPSAEPATAREA